MGFVGPDRWETEPRRFEDWNEGMSGVSVMGVWHCVMGP